MKKLSIVLVAIGFCLLTGQAQAVEDKYQFGLLINGSREVMPKMDLTYHVWWPDFAGSTLPGMSVGMKNRYSDAFSIEGMLGYRFDAIEENNGPVYVISPNLKFGKTSLVNVLEYRQGNDCLFTLHALTYPVGFVKVGIDERTLYYFDEDDVQNSAYRIGPSLRIPFSDQATVGIFYWYSFENDGQDANVYNMSLILSF